LLPGLPVFRKPGDNNAYHLQKLKAAGKIHHTGPARAGRWQVKS